MAAGSTAVCDQQTPEGAARRSRGVQRLGHATDRRPLPARKLVNDYAQFAQACPDSASGIVGACGPKSPDSHRVVWGLTSRPPVSLCGLSSGFPFARRVPPLRPPSSGFPSSGVLRFVPFGRCPGSGSPSVSLRVPFPLSNLYVSAAAGRFRRRWSRAAGTKVTSPAATTSPGSRDPPALQMGSGWARWDAATEPPVTSGRERRTSPRPNRPVRRFVFTLRSRSVTASRPSSLGGCGPVRVATAPARRSYR